MDGENMMNNICQPILI